MRRNLHWHKAALFVLLASFYATFTIFFVAICAVTLVTWLLEPERATSLAVGLLGVVIMIVVLKSTGSILAARIVNRPLDLRLIADIVLMWLMEGVLVSIIAKSLVIGFWSKQSLFVRTPKKGH